MSDPAVTREAVARLYAAQDGHALKILHVALMSGVVMFLIVVVGVIPPNPDADAQQTIENMKVFTLVNGALALGAISMSFVITRARYVAMGSGYAEDPEGGAQQFMGDLRGLHILRMAMLEGPALFGVVIVFLAKTGGALEAQPNLWLNLLTTLACLTIMAFLFPTQKAVLSIYDRVTAGR